jgi:hypothetical protein
VTESSDTAVLIPACGFFEWKKVGLIEKQAYNFGLATGSVFVFAGLRYRWRDSPQSDPINGIPDQRYSPSVRQLGIDQRGEPASAKCSDESAIARRTACTRRRSEPPSEL